jgi:N utilization substance protein B
MKGRHAARVLAFQALYSWELNRVSEEDALNFLWLEDTSEYPEDVLAFSKLIIQGCIESLEEIDAVIKDSLINWELERLSKVDLAILRIGCYTLLFQKDIPAKISIDEAVEIAKEYSQDDAFKFINGVLDSISKKQNA